MSEMALEEVLQRIIREEVAPLEKNMDAGFERVDARLDALDQKFTERFDRLETALEGVIDYKFPPIDQQRTAKVG